MDHRIESAKRDLEFAFTEYSLLERIGMRREGHLRENEWQQSCWHDTLIYAILAHVWDGQT